MFDWQEPVEGKSLDGVCCLERPIREDAAGSFYAARDPDGARVLLKMAPAGGAAAQRQLACWRRALLLSHPHLLTPRAAGEAELAGVGVVYAVFEYPDDDLAAALERAALSSGQAREALAAARSALRYLHGQWWVHGAVDRYHVVAFGETVKLLADSLRDAAGLEGYQEDARQLDALAESLGIPEAPPDTAAPFAPLPPLPPRRIPVESAAPRRFPKWILAATAVLLLLILWFHARPRPDGAASPPPAPAPAPARAPSPAASASWRVIAATFRSHEAAARKARQLNRRWPELGAAVFVPGERPGYFLVSLGGAMKREDALRMQQRARALRVPQSSYLRNDGDLRAGAEKEMRGM